MVSSLLGIGIAVLMPSSLCMTTHNDYYMTDFDENLYLEFIIDSCWSNSVLVQIGQHGMPLHMKV